MEGIWYANFKSGDIHGEGVAVLHDGKIEGGDPAHTYTGSYEEDGPQLYVNVRINPYARSSVPADLTHPVTYRLHGSVSGDSARVTGHPDNHPDSLLSVELHKGE